jgi:glycosyltransferase A (GT-A) superfamily protein (DUF2064 family)
VIVRTAEGETVWQLTACLLGQWEASSRTPESKTRLIPRLGAERAAALARAFLIDLSHSIEEASLAVGCAGDAVCSPESAAADLASFLPPSFGYVVKTNRDLGRVLAAASGLRRGRNARRFRRHR